VTVNSPKVTKWLGLLTLVASALLALINGYLGELNQDEGWYLYSARMVAGGFLPYRDFAYTQGPVMPFVYALFDPLVNAWGVAGGRLMTALLGLTAAIFASMLAARMDKGTSRFATGILAFILIGMSVYQSYFTTVVKTYALCAALLTMGLWLLHVAIDNKRTILFALAGLLVAAAAGTRVSTGAALPVIGLYLLWHRKRLGWQGWLGFGLGGGLSLALIYGPWLFICRDNFLYFAVEFHKARNAGSLLSTLVYKAGSLSRLVQAYYPALILSAPVLLVFSSKKNRPQDREANSFAGLLCLIVGGIALVHFSAPFPYDDYQVPIYPVLAAVIAWGLMQIAPRIWPGPGAANAVLVVALLAATAAAFSSPMNQSWVIAGRDRIWWQLKDKPAIAELKDAAKDIRALSGDTDVLLTQDTYLAVESGLKVPRGWELGAFCYFPDLSTDKALKLHVMNRELMAQTIRECPASAAALSGYSFAIKCPQIEHVPPEEEAAFWQAVYNRYETERTIPKFGQAATTLQILRQKEGGPPPAQLSSQPATQPQ